LTPRLLVLELTLTAVACVPLSLRRFVPDAAMTLLLPVALLGLLSAWALVHLSGRDIWKVLLLAAVPFFLFLYIGQLGTALESAGRQSLLLLPQLYGWLRDRTAVDLSAWLLALGEFSSQTGSLAQRSGTWLVHAVRGLPSEDPAARALVWSAGFWLMSCWAGWQLRRYGRVLAAVLPFTLLLALVLNFTGHATALLWVHLSCLLLLLGMVTFERRFRAWRESERDYVEIVGMYSVSSTVLLTVILVSAAYLSANTSIEAFLDRLREQRRAAQAAGGHVTDKGARPLAPRHIPSRVDELLGPHPIVAGTPHSRDVVMVISTGDLPPMPPAANPHPVRYYWRTAIFETYTGGGWNDPSGTIRDVSAGQTLMEAPPEGYRLVHEQVRFPAGSTGRLYWTGLLLSADVPIQIHRPAGPPRQEGILGTDMLSAFSPAEVYTAESLQLEPTQAQLRSATAIYPSWMVGRYMSLPDSTPERVRALARRITAAAATPYDRAYLLQDYLRQFPYTLDVPAPPSRRDAADYFLFDLKKGYCDYYATAMVVLSRAAGLPARFVTGYASGSYDSQNASYVVTDADAHSWAEIYFPGVGWVEFEPTASQPLPEREAGSAAPPLTPSASLPHQALLDRLALILSRLPLWLWPLPGAVLLLLFFWMPVKGMLLARLQPSRAVTDIYRLLRRSARPLTGSLIASQTALEYSRDLSARLSRLEKPGRLSRWVTPARDELSCLTDLYSASLFTPQRAGREAALRAARIWSRLSWRLRLARLLILLRRRA
jgi:hypothetical protein